MYFNIFLNSSKEIDFMITELICQTRIVGNYNLLTNEDQ